MKLFTKSALVVVFAVAALGFLSNEAHAQGRTYIRGNMYKPTGYNPNWFVSPGVTVKQWSYNTRLAASAYSSIPPYLFGYNPYITSVNYSTYNPYAYPTYSGYSPLLYTPVYSNPYSTYGYNPYAYLYR